MLKSNFTEVSKVNIYLNSTNGLRINFKLSLYFLLKKFTVGFDFLSNIHYIFNTYKIKNSIPSLGKKYII